MSDQVIQVSEVTEKTEDAINFHARLAAKKPDHGRLESHLKWHWRAANGALNLWMMLMPWSPEFAKERDRLQSMVDAIYPLEKAA